MVGKTAGFGAGLTIAVTGVALLVWGGKAAAGCAGFGLLATVLQTAAVAVMQPAIGAHHVTMFKRYGAGLALRLVGVVAIPVAVLLARDWFPPLAAALGYLGVLVPLLFYETRLFR